MSLILSVFTSVALTWAAEPVGEPKNFCYSDCSAEQEKIWENFEQNQFFLPADPSLFIGHCYHSAGGYKNDYPHHGVFYISTIEGQLHASGRLKFFGEGYDYITPENAKEHFPSHPEASHRLAALERSSLLDFSTEETPWRYWLRHSQNGDLLLVGQWGLFHYFFCELNRK